MNGITITEKNFNDVAARLIKFFDGADIVKWHSFDCGMKRHIPTHFPLDAGGSHIQCIYRFPHVKANVFKFREERHIRIRLNHEDVFCLKVGDVIKFCGNRIHVRTRFSTDFSWCYETYQLWDENGGFKDIRPR